MNLIRPRLRSLSKCSPVSGCLVITIVLLWILLLVEIWSRHNLLKNAYKWTESPSHSGSPAGQEWGQKGHRTRPSVLPYPGKTWQGPGMRLFQQRPRMAPLKKQTKPKTNSLLVNFSMVHTQKMASFPINKDHPLWQCQIPCGNQKRCGAFPIMWQIPKDLLSSDSYKSICYTLSSVSCNSQIANKTSHKWLSAGVGWGGGKSSKIILNPKVRIHWGCWTQSLSQL